MKAIRAVLSLLAVFGAVLGREQRAPAFGYPLGDSQGFGLKLSTDIMRGLRSAVTSKNTSWPRSLCLGV